MYNVELIKQASVELQELDSKQVVKVAGVLRKIRNWFKGLGNPEFKEKIVNLKNESAQVRSRLSNLDKKLKEIDISIEDGDIERYKNLLDDIKGLATELSKELGEVTESAAEAQQAVTYPSPEPVTENVTVGPGIFPQGILAVGDVVGDVKYGSKFTNSESVIKWFVASLVRSGVPKEKAEKAVLDINFFNSLRESIEAGKVVRREYRRSKDFEGQYLYEVLSVPFEIPGLQVKMIVNMEVTDNTYLKKNPVRNLKTIKWPLQVRITSTAPSAIVHDDDEPYDNDPRDQFDCNDCVSAKARRNLLNKLVKNAGPWYLNSAQIRQRMSEYNSGNFVPAQRTPASKEDFLSAIRQIWPQLFPEIELTEQGLNILWAHVALETGNLSSTMNYNLGNAKATPEASRSGKWTGFPCGENLNGKSYKFTAKHPMCYFRAFDTLEEGVASYLSMMGNNFRAALVEAMSGNVDEFANELKESGYYTADTDKYLKGLNSKLENPEDQEDGDFNLQNELRELSQVLGINLASRKMTQMVVNAIGKELLPHNKVSIRIKASDIPTGVEYAYILSNAISRTTDADVDVCGDGKSIEVVCDTVGSEDAIIDAVDEIDGFVAKAFQNKYKQPIISVIKVGESKLPVLSETKIEKERRKFNLQRI